MISYRRSGLCRNIFPRLCPDHKSLYRPPNRRFPSAVGHGPVRYLNLYIRLADHKDRPVAHGRLIIAFVPFYRPAVIDSRLGRISDKFCFLKGSRRTVDNGRIRRYTLVSHSGDHRRIQENRFSGIHRLFPPDFYRTDCLLYRKCHRGRLPFLR